MLKRLILALACVLSLLCLTSCMSSGNDDLNGYTRAEIKSYIELNKTTIDDLYNKFGKENYTEPDLSNKYKILVYSFTRTRTMISNYVPFKCTSNYPTMNKKLRIWVNKKGLVKKYTYDGTYYIIHRGCYIGECIMNERELTPRELDTMEVPDDF